MSSKGIILYSNSTKEAQNFPKSHYLPILKPNQVKPFIRLWVIKKGIENFR